MSAIQYGSIEYCAPGARAKHGLWRIKCERHVRNRLKRVFPSANQFATEVVSLSDTPETCRELLWFLERYPMTVQDLDRMTRQAQSHEAMERKVNQLLAAPSQLAEFDLALPPRDYQRFAATLCETTGGLLLGDKVGLGKSVSAMCSMTRPVHLPALVVTLPHLQTQWQEYLAQFAPSLKTHILKTARPYDLSAPGRSRKGQPAPEARFPDVIICNYHKLHGWTDELAGAVRYVVFDEVQELRRSDSLKYVAALEIANEAALRMGLSATPIYNYGAEFYNVLNVLRPGLLGTNEEFRREWCQDELVKDPQAFGDYLRREGALLVRTRKDVGRELPPVNRIVLPVDIDMQALHSVKTVAADLARTILAANQAYRSQKMQAAGQLDMLLRQATGVAKAVYVAQFVRMLLETEEKVVLFGWHHEVYRIWREQLSDFVPVMYTGLESPTQKEASKKAFVEGDSRIMIISLRAGAGLDGLQEVCRTAVIGELDWSPSVHEQNIGRLDRDPVSGVLDELGPVFAYFLVAEDGSDPVVSDILGLKRMQLDGVRHAEQTLVEALQIDPDHIKKLAESYLRKIGEPPK
ncbi:DEAD/DEAH box helicase [Hydrogenophaga aromaticivorans]|uniref:DEAD/DEAH box helicase n=1 Tax=Hydrogenophaga aromaticivorans TaxID=2610898 RepID=UPI0031EA9795